MVAAAVEAASGAAQANADELEEFRAAVREVVEALRGQLTSACARPLVLSICARTSLCGLASALTWRGLDSTSDLSCPG